MRTFPNVWVPPGGSIEAGDESLLAAGLRELREEVGIDLTNSAVTQSRPLCLWESVYPTSLEGGQPRRQHCVVYFLVKVDRAHDELEARPDFCATLNWLGERVWRMGPSPSTYTCNAE